MQLKALLNSCKYLLLLQRIMASMVSIFTKSVSIHFTLQNGKWLLSFTNFRPQDWKKGSHFSAYILNATQKDTLLSLKLICYRHIYMKL